MPDDPDDASLYVLLRVNIDNGGDEGLSPIDVRSHVFELTAATLVAAVTTILAIVVVNHLATAVLMDVVTAET